MNETWPTNLLVVEAGGVVVAAVEVVLGGVVVTRGRHGRIKATCAASITLACIYPFQLFTDTLKLL